MLVSLPSDKLHEIQQLAHTLLQRQQSIRLHPFWARPSFVPMDMHNSVSCVV